MGDAYAANILRVLQQGIQRNKPYTTSFFKATFSLMFKILVSLSYLLPVNTPPRLSTGRFDDALFETHLTQLVSVKTALLIICSPY